jgi:hypothetical protein
VVIDCDVVTTDDLRQLVTRKCPSVDVDWRIVGPEDPFPNGGKLVVAVEKNGFHKRLVPVVFSDS